MPKNSTIELSPEAVRRTMTENTTVMKTYANQIKQNMSDLIKALDALSGEPSE